MTQRTLLRRIRALAEHTTSFRIYSPHSRQAQYSSSWSQLKLGGYWVGYRAWRSRSQKYWKQNQEELFGLSQREITHDEGTYIENVADFLTSSVDTFDNATASGATQRNVMAKKTILS